MTDNVAILAGFTREVWASCEEREGPFLIQPDANLDDYVRAWNMDTQAFEQLNGGMWMFKDA
jgi:hypothetical protein